MKKSIVLAFLLFLTLALPLFAFATHGGEHPPGGGIPQGPQTGSELLITLNSITNWLFIALLIFAVIFIVLAAFQFLTGGGEPQQIAEARRKLIYAAIAIIVGSLARGIPAAISNIVGL